MGFIPIFISLGGFVFLFTMLVNYNLNSKKKSYFIQLESLRKMVTEAYPAQPIGDDMELKALEHQFREAKKQSKSSNDASVDIKIDSQFVACKMARFQYQQLKETKPYFFVAKLFGHADI
ncbi:MAG TPA: hypothetical protein VK957_12740 [Lunatimonas sp.]|nr:hypothetical protein [Lunatimonas sp.]